MKVAVKKIQISKKRIRKNFGDIDGLKNSIHQLGLLSPILIDQDNNLLAGERRLRACRELGFQEVDVHVVNLTNPLMRLEVEIHENYMRKDFDESERNKGIEQKKKMVRKRLWCSRMRLFVKRLKDLFLFCFRWKSMRKSMQDKVDAK